MSRRSTKSFSSCAMAPSRGSSPAAVRGCVAVGFAAALLLVASACSHKSEAALGADGGAPAAALAVSGPFGAPTGSGALKAEDLPDLPPQEGLPVVDLGGEYRASPLPKSGAALLYARAFETHVYAKPDAASGKLGQLRAGAAIETEGGELKGAGCPGGFRKIRPMGFVCMDQATLDAEQPLVNASFRRPALAEKLPYMYGIVKRGGPEYAHLPTEAEVKQHEPNLAQHLRKWAKDKESGANYAPELWLRDEKPDAPAPLEALASNLTSDDIPAFLQNGARLPNLSGLIKGVEPVKIGEAGAHNGVSFIDTMLWSGRRFGLTADLRLLPTDRLRPIRGSEYHGVRIGTDVQLPFALIRRKAQKRYKFEGGRRVSAGPLEWRSAVELTGHQRFYDHVLHYETKDGSWIEDRSASRIDGAKKLPGWALKGEKWIDVNLMKQVITLYEGDKPVYATLVSTGEAGLGDPETSKSTRQGIFRVHTKFITTTMDSRVIGEEFELRDVPYVQYFQDGYALHASYWHDVFGMPKSHGCINLAPEDARRLFHWTEPQVPPGWHGAAKALTGTVVYIHP
jgi:L,D-transpeptidase catalytic domain